MADPNADALHGRQALYGGLLSSLGATLGWLLWFAIQAVQRDWRVLLAPAFGAALGLALDWLAHYLRVAAQEADGLTPRDADRPALDWARPGALAVIFLAAACQSYVSDHIYAVLLPFLASLATLFPVGLVFGRLCCTSIPPGTDSLWEPLVYGAGMGLLAALAAFVVQFLMGGVFTGQQSVGNMLWSLVGWWCLLGTALGLTRALSKEPTVLGPVLGVVLALAVVFVFSLPGLYAWVSKLPGVFGLVRIVIDEEVNQMLSSPDLPAAFWEDAEKRLDHKADAGGTVPAPESPWGLAVAGCLGCTEAEQAALPPGQGVDLSALRTLPPPRLSRVAEALTTPEGQRTDEDRQALKEWDEYQASLAAARQQLDRIKELPPNPLLTPPPDPSRARLDKLCKELRRGERSGLVRSWLVVLLFSLGLGLAPLAEQALRPRNYAGSRTHRNDQALGKFLFVLVLAAIGLVWLVRPK